MIELLSDEDNVYAIVSNGIVQKIFKGTASEATEMLIWSSHLTNSVAVLRRLNKTTLKWEDVSACR